MNTSIRKVALGLALAFAALFANLQYVQLARSHDLATDPRNRRLAFEEEKIKRGVILAADGTVLATSVLSGDSRFIWTRRYPQGPLFGHITGWYTSPFFCDSNGVERTQNDYLSGREPPRATDFVDELLGRVHDGNRVRLTVIPELQALARAKLGRQRGGAAVIDTNTGAVLALYGNPSYDPNLITKPKLGACAKAKRALDRSGAKVLLSRAYQVRYPPGSTFKIITLAAALEAGMGPGSRIPTFRRLDLPDTDKTLGNFGGSSCGGTLRQSFLQSCNTAFAWVGLNKVGERKLAAMATKFGLNREPELDLAAIPSCVQAPFTGHDCDEVNLSRPFIAYSAIGQGDVRVTPLQMALAGAAVSNGGFLVRPHVVDRVLDAETNQILLRVKPQRSGPIYSKRTATLMRELMTGVVRNGTGRVVGFSRRWEIGGKTGTAQTGRCYEDPRGRRCEAPHVWFVAWGPGVAVAVVVDNGGNLGGDATGGRVAGPIAKALLERALADRERRR